MSTPPNSAESTEVLLERCIQGDADSWAVLVERFGRLVYSVPARAGLAPEARDDVFQVVWLLTHRHLSQLRDARGFPSWLVRTAQRETWRASKKINRDAAGPSTGPVQVLAWADPEQAERLERLHQVRAALDGIGEPCRSLLTELFRSDSAGYTAIAERLGVPRGSVGPTRARCMERLKGAMENNGLETEHRSNTTSS